MKTIKQLLVVLVAIFGMSACQKEFSLENGAFTKAVGVLRDSLGNCQPVSVNGTFEVGKALTVNDYVYVLVNIASPGSYKIFSDQQNGFSFSDSGTITATGLQTIKLKSTGQPILPIQTDFTVVFDSSFCFFSVFVNPASTGGGAKYTLAATGGNCSGATPQGTYQQGVALGASNKVSIQVNVTDTGSYSITTGNVNGMTFSASGTFTTTGVQTVVLQGSGTPSTAGANTIPLTAGGTTCNFTVTVTPAAGAATFTLTGSPGSCSNANVQGTYTAGTALGSTNKVSLEVNVTVAGTYSITTSTVNGMTFSGSGTLATGAQTITLQGTGTPTAAGTSTFPITAGSSSCNFTVTVMAGSSGNVNQSDTAWQFNQGTSYFKGSFDTAFTATDPTLGFYLYMYGPSNNISGDSLDIAILFPGGSIQTGTFSTATQAFFYYYNATTDKYSADPSITTATMNITITSYTGGIVQGTFTGTAENSVGAPVPITNGRFKAKVN